MTETQVVSVDFGKEQRDSARKFARLLGLIEDQNEEFLRNPDFFFKQASGEIRKWQKVVYDAKDALRHDCFSAFPEDESTITPSLPEIISVPKDDWDRLQKCAAIIEKACNK